MYPFSYCSAYIYQKVHNGGKGLLQQDRERSQSSGELKMRIHTCYINFLKLVQFQKEISSGTHVPKVTKWYPKIMSLLLDNVINIKENEQGANNLKCNIITPQFAQKMRKSCESKQEQLFAQ